MKANGFLALVLTGAAGVLGVQAVAGAQDLGALSGLAGGLDVSALASASAGNAAGIVEYCMKNNFLSGDAAGGIKGQLMSKVNGGSAADKADYADGAKGLLKTGDGNSVDLGEIGQMKESLTKKACSSVLDHAKSLL